MTQSDERQMGATDEVAGPDFRDSIDPTEVVCLGENPNVAGNRNNDDAVDHEQLIGEPLPDDDPELDAHTAAGEDDLPEDTTPEAGA